MMGHNPKARSNTLTPPLLRVLISLWRLQEFKGWNQVSVHDFPQVMPYNAGRTYTSVRAMKDLEALQEIGLAKRLKSTTNQIVCARNRKQGTGVIPVWDYAISKAGQEVIDILASMGLPRWIDV